MPPREIDTSPTPNFTWNSLLIHARNSRNEIRSALQQNFSKPTIVQTTEGLKIFALGNPLSSAAQTLVSVDISPSHISNILLQSYHELDIIGQSSTQPQSRSRKISRPPAELKFESVFRQDPFRVTTPSAEFSLMCERQRTNVVNGLTDFSTQGGSMLLLAGDQIYKYSTSTQELLGLSFAQNMSELDDVMDVDNHSSQVPQEHTPGCRPETPSPVQKPAISSKTIPISSSSSSTQAGSTNFVSDAKICPVDNSIIAYVLNKQVYIDRNGKQLYHTKSNSKFVSNGVPAYICLEELDRFEGIWWSSKETRLLYERVDERMVEEASFGVNGKEASPPMKYPRAGTTNAFSTLRMIIIEGEKVYDIGLKIDLKRVIPHEYITRAGFYSDGKSVWVQIMSRQQTECTLMIIPETDFELPVEFQARYVNVNEKKSDNHSHYLFACPEDDCDFGTWQPPAAKSDERAPRTPLRTSTIVHQAKYDHWINVNNAIVPLEIEEENSQIYRFTYYSETSKGNFLHLLSAGIDEWGTKISTSFLELMDPTVSLNKSIQVKVDEKRKLVYYVANESHATEWNVCVACYTGINEKTGRAFSRRLTELQMSFKPERANANLALDFDVGFACWVTSCRTAPTCRFYKFQFDDQDCLPRASLAAVLSLSGLSSIFDEVRMERPELIEYTSPRSQCTFYGLVLRPSNYDPDKSYPVLHYVYGGPGIQLVHNDFATWVPFIKYTKLGFVVVMIDNRGTANRGIQFERPIGGQLGSVEVEDQVEGLKILAERTHGIMDLSRVVVHGWSYGGYMSLLMIANHPNVYRGAIAGGAVTDWKLYDTAYTERYMGYPIKEHVYEPSSILPLVEKLPDEPNRLMLIHGMMDENVHMTHLCSIIDACIKRGKFHELLIFPSERHGIRNSDSASYLDARMMHFIQNCLREPQRDHTQKVIHEDCMTTVWRDMGTQAIKNLEE